MSKLKATQVKNLEPREKPYKVFDGEGMYIHVMPNGKKYWRLAYRLKGKTSTLGLGVYSDKGKGVSLADARKKRNKAKELLDKSIDPSQQRKDKRQTEKESIKNTFRDIAEEFFATKEWKPGRTKVWKPEHEKKQRIRLKQINERFGDQPINSITSREILNFLREIGETGKNKKTGKTGSLDTAIRMGVIMSQVFRHGIWLGILDLDPTNGLRGRLGTPEAKHFPFLEKSEDIGELMRRISVYNKPPYNGNSLTRYALEFLALTFVRPGELRHAEWSEIDWIDKLWRIPKEKMKAGNPHVVPLSSRAFEILKEIRSYNLSSKLVFPRQNSSTVEMSDNTLNKALRILDYKGIFVAHGFRHMASTRLHELGKPSHLIEKQLAHKETNTVKAAYNHAEYIEERRELMQFWSDYLEGLGKKATETLHRGI